MRRSESHRQPWSTELNRPTTFETLRLFAMLNFIVGSYFRCFSVSPNAESNSSKCDSRRTHKQVQSTTARAICIRYNEIGIAGDEPSWQSNAK